MPESRRKHWAGIEDGGSARMREGRALVAAFTGVSCFLACLEAIWLLTGAIGVSLGRAGSIAGVVIAFGAAVFFAAILIRGFRPGAGALGGGSAPEDLGHPKSAERFFPIAGWIITGTSLIRFLFVWGRLWRLASLRPPYDWDGLYYHIPAINAWAVQGRIGWVDGGADVPFVNYPMGVEAMTFITHRVLGTSALVTAGNLWFWPLAFLGLAVIARLLGARGPWPWWAGSLLVSAPVLICQSITCYSDPGFAATVIGAIAATGLLLFGHEYPFRGRALVWGANVGLLLGAKGTGAPFAVAIVAAGIAGLLITPRWLPATHLEPAGSRASRKERLLPLVPALLVMLAVGGVWYLRNWAVSGNPIYPIEVRFGAKVILPGYDPVAFSEANLPGWLKAYPKLLRMPVSWMQLDAPIQGYAPVGGLGYLWPFACVPAILVLVVLTGRRFAGHAGSSPWLKRSPFTFLALLSFLLFLIQTSRWWSRLTVWFLALGLPSLAVLLGAGLERSRRIWWKGALLLVFAGVVSLTVWESSRTLAIEERTGLMDRSGPPPDPGVRTGGGAAYRSSADMLFPDLTGNPGFDRVLHEKTIARGPWGRLGTLLGGVLSLPLGARETLVLPPEPSPEDLDRVRRMGVQWIVWDLNGASPMPAVIREAAEEEITYRPAPDLDFRFVRIKTGREVGARAG